MRRELLQACGWILTRTLFAQPVVDGVPKFRTSMADKTAFAIVQFYRTGEPDENENPRDQVCCIPTAAFVYGVSGALHYKNLPGL
jgi:hypothetical protein